MPAPGDQDAFVPGRLHGPAQVHARLRAARTLAQTIDGVDADHHDRLPPAFAQTPGDDADHAGVPVLARDHHHGGFVVVRARRLDPAHRLFRHLGLDLAPGDVQGVQFLRQHPRLVGIVGGQQART
ncbi:hypothetical protein D3C71_1029120 [compost metagenome]